VKKSSASLADSPKVDKYSFGKYFKLLVIIKLALVFIAAAKT
jgi:hypothetical protein